MLTGFEGKESSFRSLARSVAIIVVCCAAVVVVVFVSVKCIAVIFFE